VQSHLRAEDLFGRLGGDEFGILCRATTSATAATLADRIRDLVEALPIAVGAAVVRVTMSAGVAAIPELPCKSVQDLMNASDRALYKAKAHGRNQVAASSSEPIEDTRVVARPQPPLEPEE